MTVTGVLIALAAVCIVWFVVTSMLIYDSLRRRNQPVSLLWLRLMLPAYANRYKEITKKEKGRTGPLFYHWIVSINMALVLAVASVIASR